jgi:DNA-directed RNA polymerase III subunit RPC6
MTSTVIKTEPGTMDAICEQIMALCKDFPDGVGDKVLQNDMPDIDPKVRAKAINTLLNSGKIDLFKSESKGLLYRLKNVSSSGSGIKGDQEEKIVYGIIEESANKGTWIRDIRVKSNLVQTQLNRVLKALESKKLIKIVKSVNATKKKVYM